MGDKYGLNHYHVSFLRVVKTMSNCDQNGPLLKSFLKYVLAVVQMLCEPLMFRRIHEYLNLSWDLYKVFLLFKLVDI